MIPNQSENGKYNQFSVGFNKISKNISLCAYGFEQAHKKYESKVYIEFGKCSS